MKSQTNNITGISTRVWWLANLVQIKLVIIWIDGQQSSKHFKPQMQCKTMKPIRGRTEPQYVCTQICKCYTNASYKYTMAVYILWMVSCRGSWRNEVTCKRSTAPTRIHLSEKNLGNRKYNVYFLFNRLITKPSIDTFHKRLSFVIS